MEATTKRRLVLLVKLVLTVGIAAEIFRRVLLKEDAAELWARVTRIDARWLAPAAAAQIFAILCGVERWRSLLTAQGVRAPFRHLFGTYMIGRFFGAVTPGGLGLQGYMIYDLARRTQKAARVMASVGITVIAGQLGFALVVIAGSIYGAPYLGRTGVMLIDAAFLALIVFALTILSRPRVVQAVASRALGGVPTRIQTLLDAVCAYHGEGLRLARAVLLSFGVHVGHVLIYVCAARSLGLEIGAGEVFFVTTVQILATIVPISINGVGVREAAAVGMYTIVGVPAGLAVLVPIVGFAVEMAISTMGGLVLLVRRHDYHPVIEIDHPEREDRIEESIAVAAVELPVVRRGLLLGFSGGLFAGLVVGLTEGAVVLLSGSDAPDFGVLWYGATAYAVLCALLGAPTGLALAMLGRFIRKQATPEPKAFGAYAGLFAAIVAFGLTVFRVRRDVFHEELVMKSKQGLLVLGGSALGALVLYFVLSSLLRVFTRTRAGRWMLHPVGVPLFAALVIGGLVGLHVARPVRVAGPSGRTLPPAPAQASNVLVIVVDTLRADHLPAYGYADGRTPNLDAFARDAVRYDQHFANASWTRPSFASILSGRYPSSHGVMSKADALPNELTTMAEAFAGGGYYTSGFVTNFNVAPFFNFQQGFDEFTYLEPDFVLGANDSQQKLLLMQFARRIVERFRPALPGSAYQDASVVNTNVLRWLDRAPANAPFFLFAAYMDPHDPYFEHPYRGSGYSRAIHQEPAPEEAEHLRRLYDGEITYWDEQFGRLVAELRRRGLYDQMTIVVTADHGEEFMEHGGFWHGTTLYDEQVRVPLFVKLPFKARSGEVVSSWSQSIDLLPSLLRQNGLAAVAGVQGRDDLLENGFAGTADVFAEESHEGNVLRSLRARRGRAAVKIITANEGNPRGLAPVEMYRIDQDPDELVNVADDEPLVSGLMAERLRENEHAAAEGRVRESNQVVATGAARQALEALGYATDSNHSTEAEQGESGN